MNARTRQDQIRAAASPIALARALLPLFVVTFGIAGCEDTFADPGTDAQLQVSGAQFRREALPAETTGPVVRTVDISPIVVAGVSDRRCSGAVDPAGTAVAIALEGDPGYWVVPTGVPDIGAPGLPTFASRVGFAKTLTAGPHTLVTRAVDADGHFGPPFTRTLDVTAFARPTGRLVVALTWSGTADLDLRVVDPNGVEIWKRNINSYEPPPPGSPPEAPGTVHVGGVLDIDSNAACVTDGRNAENVVWTESPPSGHYLVRVDTPSLCDDINAYWHVEAFLDGVSVAKAEGLSIESDTRLSHDRGAGVLATAFDVP